MESLHWLLDVIYREDHNKTLDKHAAFNLSALRKLCLHVLKILRIPKQDLSSRRKKRYISVHLEDSLSQFFGEINHTALINRGSNQFKTTQRDKKGAEIFHAYGVIRQRKNLQYGLRRAIIGSV